MRVIQLSTLKKTPTPLAKPHKWKHFPRHYFQGEEKSSSTSTSSLTEEKFYRKFYSTYNIFQQKKAIYRKSCCTLRLQKQNKILEKNVKLSVNCWSIFTALKTRHAAGISSKIKGSSLGTEIKLHTMNINISEIHLQTHPTKLTSKC